MTEVPVVKPVMANMRMTYIPTHNAKAAHENPPRNRHTRNMQKDVGIVLPTEYATW